MVSILMAWGSPNLASGLASIAASTTIEPLMATPISPALPMMGLNPIEYPEIHRDKKPIPTDSTATEEISAARIKERKLKIRVATMSRSKIGR